MSSPDQNMNISTKREYNSPITKILKKIIFFACNLKFVEYTSLCYTKRILRQIEFGSKEILFSPEWAVLSAKLRD